MTCICISREVTACYLPYWRQSIPMSPESFWNHITTQSFRSRVNPLYIGIELVPSYISCGAVTSSPKVLALYKCALGTNRDEFDRNDSSLKKSKLPGNFRTWRPVQRLSVGSCTSRRLFPSSAGWRRHRRRHARSPQNTDAVKTTRWSCWPGPAHTIPDRCESSSTFCTTSPEPSLSPTSRESRRRSAAAAAESFCPSFSRVSFQQLNKVLTAKWETERISVYSSRARTIYPATASVGESEGTLNVCSTRSPVSSISPLETVCGQMLTGQMLTPLSKNRINANWRNAHLYVCI